jgi:hypothetical protein
LNYLNYRFIFRFVEEVSDRRKASLSGTKRKVEESTEEAESAETAKGIYQVAASEKVERAANLLPP